MAYYCENMYTVRYRCLYTYVYQILSHLTIVAGENTVVLLLLLLLFNRSVYIKCYFCPIWKPFGIDNDVRDLYVTLLKSST